MTRRGPLADPSEPPEAHGQVAALHRIDQRRAALPRLSDEALLAACGVGDAAALGELFDRHHEAIYRLVSRLLRTDPSEIDDLVQTTFLTVWHSAARFAGRGSVKSFLFGVAANTVRRHIRNTRRRRTLLASWLPPVHAAAPDDAVAQAQQVGQLAAALDGLPHDLRVAYVLCDLEDIPGVEVARLLDIRPGTLWRRLHEARRALRSAIDGGEP